MLSDLKIVGVFLIGTVVWISSTDWIVMQLFPDITSLVYYNYIKGIIYSILASIFVYVVVRKRTAKVTSTADQLSVELQEKKALIGELHHRVKNNLAVLSALIDLQLTFQLENEVKSQLNIMKYRVHAIARIQELMYSHERISEVNIISFLKSYTKELSIFYQRMVLFDQKTTSDMILNLNVAVPLGILYNEILQLLFVHSGNKEAIKVSLDENDSEIIMDLIAPNLKRSLESLDEAGSIQPLIIDLYSQQLNADLITNYSKTKELIHISLTIPKKNITRGAFGNM